MYEVHIYTSGVFPRDMSQVCIWRSSGQGQGHRSDKGPQLEVVKRIYACQDKSASAQVQ